MAGGPGRGTLRFRASGNRFPRPADAPPPPPPPPPAPPPPPGRPPPGRAPGEQPLLYIDRHLVHEVTSPQAFEGLRVAGRRVRRPEATFATPDHNIPTTDRRLPIADPISKAQIDTLRANCREFGIRG